MNRLILILITTLFTANAFSVIKVEIFADDAYPPYAYIENGKLTGIYTVVLEKIFEKMSDYDVTFKGVPWKRGLDSIKKGDIFALYPPYERPKERPYMEYNTGILDEALVVYCRNEVLETDRNLWPEDYYGLTIGNNIGFSAGGEKFWQAVKDKKIQVTETKGATNNLLKLIKGRLDCYMNDGLSIRWELKLLAEKGIYDGQSLSQGAVISKEQGFLGFATDGQNFLFKKDFQEKYYKILKEMIDSGEIKSIVNEYVK